MVMIVDNRIAQRKLDAQIEVLSAELRVLKSRRNELSPVSQLPPEILRAIYVQVEECDPKKPPRPVILSHVCRFWRELVVGFPRLWTDIRMRNGTSPSLLDLMLKNSRKLPIQVSFKSESDQDSPILLAIQKVLSAPECLQSLDLSCKEQAMKTCLLHALGRAESLEFLRIQKEWGPFPLLLNLLSGGTPNLRHFHLENCIAPLNFPLLLQSPRLTHLILRDLRRVVSTSELWRVLRGTPQLQFLECSLFLSADADDFEGDLAPAELPDLRSLKIHGDLVGLSNVFRDIRIPMSIEVLEIIFEPEDTIHLEEPLFALKSALGNPSLHDFISPRQLRLYNYSENLVWGPHVGIRSWREFPPLNAKAQLNLIHSPRGPVWKTFSFRTLHPHSTDTVLLPFLQWKAHTAFWTLTDLRYLEMDVSEPQTSVWAMFAQLPNLEEVVVGRDGLSTVLFDALQPPDVQEQAPGSAAVAHSPYPFPALRALVFHTALTESGSLLLYKALEARQQFGARLEYLESEGFESYPMGQRMSSVATIVVQSL